MNKPSITVSIPAFNEEQTVERVAKEAISSLKKITTDWELLLINDGSTDQTGPIINRLAKKNKHIRIISHKTNLGFSAVITEGLFSAQKDLVFLAPADGQFNFKELYKFVKKIQDYDGVLAYRTHNVEPINRKIQSFIYHVISKLLFGIRLKEFSSVYLWRTSILQDLKINSSPRANTAQIEILYKILDKGGRVTGLPIHWRYRQGGKPKGTINLILILSTLKDMVKLFLEDRIKDIPNKFSYYFTELAVKILTFNLFTVKKLIKPYIKKQDSVLDLGCGIGTMSTMFLPKNYFGVDIDDQAIRLAKKDHPIYKFDTADITKFRTERKFDLIIIVGVLHHLSDKDTNETLAGLSNFLQKSGKVVIIEAIPPVFKFNLIGYWLRDHDKGRFIRPTEKYKSLIEKWFHVERCESKLGGFFDYAYLVVSNLKNQ